MELADNIYVNTDNIKGQSNRTLECVSSRTQTAGSKARGEQLYRWVSACLGLLCVLLLTAVIVLTVYFNSSADDIKAKARALEAERDELQTNYSRLDSDRFQLQTKYNKCIKSQGCPQGWIGFTSRCYHISSEQKSWTESQQDCKQRGADLVIINSLEEQKFINKFSKAVWLGLTDRDAEGTWKWVDGTKLTIKFWKENEPNDHNQNEDCAVSTVESNPRYSWNDLPCTNKQYWICERGP